MREKTPKLMWSFSLYKFQYSGGEKCKTGETSSEVLICAVKEECRVLAKGGFTVVGSSGELFLAYEGSPNRREK